MSYIGVRDHIERALSNRARGWLVELGMMMRLQYCYTGNSRTIIHQRDPDDATWVRTVLYANQVAIMPVKTVDPSRYYRVRLRQSGGLAAGRIHTRDPGRQRYI